MEIAGQKETATAARGQWRVTLKPLPAGGPYTLTISGENTVAVKNVLVGEVWLCSGQSNMEKQVGPRPPQPEVTNWKNEVAAADYPQIRVLTVPGRAAASPQETFKGGWKVCSPQTAGDFSATAYFFGRELFQEEERPRRPDRLQRGRD